MAEKKKWKRPQDVETIRTNNPNKMVGKWLPKKVLKTWGEDFVDESTGETITVERNEVLMEPCYISKDKAAQLQFFIEAGDIKDVEFCNDPICEMILYTPRCMSLFNVELHFGFENKAHYVVRAQHISQAITIAAEFGQMYRNVSGWTRATRVVSVDAYIVPDDHPCIPEDARTPAEESKVYFKVTVRTEWEDFDGKPRRGDQLYVIAANEVGEAKERIARLLDIMTAEAKKRGDERPKSWRQTIRKVVPFDVDCIVPVEYSELYREKPTD